MTQSTDDSQQSRARKIIDDYRRVFHDDGAGSPANTVLRDLMAETGFFQTSYQSFAGEASAQQAAFNDGKRAIMLHILYKLDRSWDSVTDLMEDGAPYNPLENMTHEPV